MANSNCLCVKYWKNSNAQGYTLKIRVFQLSDQLKIIKMQQQSNFDKNLI